MKRNSSTPKNTAILIGMAVSFFVSLILTGCSGIRPYSNTMAKNLFLDVQTDRGVHTSLDIYRVGPDCRVDYRGTVRLGKGNNEVGIPTDKWLLLAVNFARSSIIFGNSSIGHGTMFKARSGKVYKAMAIYRDDMYNVEYYEAASRKAKGREVEHIELSRCQAVIGN